MTEFLIVGRGLAATVLMHTFRERGISFRTIGDPSLSPCSRVAAGIWHPVVFKRMTLSWRADEFIPFLIEFYRACEDVLNERLLTTRPLIRGFTESQEERLWTRKSVEELEGFIDPVIHSESNQFPHLKIGNSFSYVWKAGNLDVRRYLEASESFFKEVVDDGIFDHSHLEVTDAGFKFQNRAYKNVIFCEGHLVSRNPYFHWAPMRPAKGEILTVKIKERLLNAEIFNKDGFLIDIDKELYRVGATYEWERLQGGPTAEKRAELEQKLIAMTDCEYDVVSHEAGVRPSSFDRRPIIGEHPEVKGLHIFNGLGTKGVMLAPWFASKFVNFCRQEETLEPEVDVRRFRRLYDATKNA